jgi:hypothetical protein
MVVLKKEAASVVGNTSGMRNTATRANPQSTTVRVPTRRNSLRAVSGSRRPMPTISETVR